MEKEKMQEMTAALGTNLKRIADESAEGLQKMQRLMSRVEAASAKSLQDMEQRMSHVAAASAKAVRRWEEIVSRLVELTDEKQA